MDRQAMLIVLTVLGALVFGLLVGTQLASALPAAERRLVPFAVPAHGAAAFAHVWVVRQIYGGGDMTMYWDHGQRLASVLGHDSPRFWGTVLSLVLQIPEVRTPVAVYGIGTSTGTMTGIAAGLASLLPDSLDAACVVVAIASMIGKLFLHLALRDQSPPHLRHWILLAILYLPSSLFWSAGLLKEALLMLPLGLFVFGARRLTLRFSLSGLTLVLVAAVPIALLKPYLVVALALAAAAWFYADRARNRGGTLRVRPLYLLLAIGIGFGGAVALGAFFPRYALSNLADEAARLQEVGASVEGGSNYSLKATSADLGHQLAIAPLALLTGLFRPFVFEARNATMLLAALETLVILLLFVRVLARSSSRRALRQITESPILLFCVVFSLMTALAVGMASTNLGTLSRYRMPMTPFAVSALVTLLTARSSKRALSSPSPPKAA